MAWRVAAAAVELFSSYPLNTKIHFESPPDGEECGQN
jgi:hypothetical protein